MALYSRALKADERLRMEELLADEDEELARRVRIVLMSSQREGVHEISAAVGLHPINVRKWIHRFNKYGLKGLYPRRSPGRPRLFTREQRDAIVGLATTDPRVLGLEFDNWSLQRLRTQLIERGVMNDVSAETIRQELLRSGLVFDERRWVSLER
ncbi:MAG: helix-turn-helix domain-containing protein [Anaerolineae bacterium]|jgi:transposase|nr:helix-turn-helix domain-containing protein [Anaerolineae bacterium]